jgi:hypothetical protein
VDVLSGDKSRTFRINYRYILDNMRRNLVLLCRLVLRHRMHQLYHSPRIHDYGAAVASYLTEENRSARIKTNSSAILSVTDLMCTTMRLKSGLRSLIFILCLPHMPFATKKKQKKKNFMHCCKERCLKFIHSVIEYRFYNVV